MPRKTATMAATAAANVGFFSDIVTPGLIPGVYDDSAA
jgi:hypothetical protein